MSGFRLYRRSVGRVGKPRLMELWAACGKGVENMLFRSPRLSHALSTTEWGLSTLSTPTFLHLLINALDRLNMKFSKYK